jgi:hypothetical protein
MAKPTREIFIDFRNDGLELVGARLEDLHDDVWSFPWRR